MDYVSLCERFVAQEFPAAEIVVIGGSTATGSRTPSSDIDLLVVGDEIFADGSVSLAATYEFGGEILEVFAYTSSGYAVWAQRGLDSYRPVIVHMLVEGQEVRGGSVLAEFRDRWTARLAAGSVVGEHEMAMRRYVITDLLDDVRDAVDDLERSVVAWSLFQKIAELMILTERGWVGTGKYLPRRLREVSAGRADKLTTPLLEGDFIAFAACVEEELTRAGGRVQQGFIR